MVHYTIRGFRNNKFVHTSGQTDARPTRETAKHIATAVKGEGIYNCTICIFEDKEGNKKIYELKSGEY